MGMSILSRLDPDIMHTHILSRLDGTTLTALSLVCPELRHLICNNTEDLWRNICTSTWPSLLLDPLVHNIISTFPGGYRSFFSDAFPSLHHHKNSHCSYPPTIDLIHTLDIYIHGEPLISRVRLQSLNTNSLPNIVHVIFDDLDIGCIHNIPVKEEWNEYLQENLRLSWIIIDPTRKRAANLLRSSCKPISVEGPDRSNIVQVLYTIVMAGECQVRTEMVKCRVKVMCLFKDGGVLHVFRVVIYMDDDEYFVDVNQGVTILLNAIQNGERKKFDLSKQEFDKLDAFKEEEKKKHQ